MARPLPSSGHDRLKPWRPSFGRSRAMHISWEPDGSNLRSRPTRGRRRPAPPTSPPAPALLHFDRSPPHARPSAPPDRPRGGDPPVVSPAEHPHSPPPPEL